MGLEGLEFCAGDERAGSPGLPRGCGTLPCSHTSSLLGPAKTQMQVV